MSKTRIVATRRRPERHLQADPLGSPSIAFPFTFAGKPAVATIIKVVMVDKVEIDFAGIRAYATIPASTDAVFRMHKIDNNGHLIGMGTLTFKAGMPSHINVAGYNGTLEPGDVMQLTSPEVQDVMLTDVNITIRTLRV